MKGRPVILVVDDQPQNLELLETFLVPQGYEIVKAANGEEALGKISGNQIDLMLLDVMMPGIDGFEVTRRVRKDKTHRLLPIVLVTGLRETEDRLKGIEAGCDDFISKPINMSELLARVRSLLKVKAYNDLLGNYQKELEAEVIRRTEELNQANLFQQRLIDALPVPVFYKDSAGRYLGCNSSFEKYIGKKAEKIVGKSIYDLAPKELADSYLEKDLALLRHPGLQIYDSTVKDADGTVRNVIFHKATFLNMDDSVGGLIGAILDITDRKRAEEELVRKTAFLEAQTEATIDGILMVDSRNQIIMTNRRFLDIMKVPKHIRDVKDDQSLLQYVTNTTREPAAFLEKVKYLYDHPNEASRDEIEFKDGMVLDRYSAPVLSKDGNNYGRVWFFRDITNRKRAEDALRERDRQFTKLSFWVPGMIYQFTQRPDGTYHVPFSTEAVKDLFGCSPQEVCEDFSPIAGMILPEDFDKLFESIKYSAKHLTVWSCEYRVQIPGQSIKWLFGKATPEKLADGSITWYGFNTDITERKLMENKLKQSEERYRSIFENAQEGIFRTTPDGKVIMANQAMAKIYGYETPEEMMTSVTDAARQHYVNPEDRRKIRETIEENGFIKEQEVQNYRKDGTIIWISRTMQAIRDEKGQSMYYDGMLEDITIRKEAVERIRRALGATVQAIAVIVETRDPYTAGHQRRVADLAQAIAEEMKLSLDSIEGIRVSAAIHDLGKMSVPAEILSKPTKLTDLEFSLIKTHPQAGYDILKDIDFPWAIARIVLEHHERMNGSGYPNGLYGDSILMESRIIAVADVVESMASHRPYRPSLGIDASLGEIEKNRGTLYDSTVVDSCLRLFRGKGFQLKVI
jgi:PAS domain S-box-containing protein